MIVLDLEFNSGWYSVNMEEILQIGAVKIDYPGGPIKSAFNAYIRPSVHKRLSPIARLLPEVQSSMDSPLDFRQAFALFLDWVGDERVCAEWGRNDVRVLFKNACYWGLEAKLPDYCVDLQTAFGRTVDAKNGLPLSRAVEYCGIPDSFVFHDALNDAMYTALVTRYIDERTLKDCAFALTERDIHPVIPPKQPKKNQTRSGPFDSRKQALSSRSSRRVACPECGTVLCVNEWATQDGTVFYARCSCGGHKFIRRLRMMEAPDGRFWTYTDTISWSSDNVKLLSAAQNYARHTCAPDKSPRRRRRS